jgi:hypothetical protein
MPFGNSEYLVTIERQEVLAEREISPHEKLPKEYDSYTFFLFPNHRWLINNKRLVNDLYYEFKDFGNAIGKKNLAIWFSDTDGNPDTARALDFTNLFGLDVNSGPYIVYIKPKHSSVKEIVIDRSNIGIIETKMSDLDLKLLNDEDFSDKFAISFSDLGMEDTTAMLNIMKSQIRGNNFDLSILKKKRAAYQILILVDKLSTFIDKIKVLEVRFQRDGIFFM